VSDPNPVVRDDEVMVRGGILLMAAKLVHVFSGFGLYFFLLVVLTRLMGDTAGTEAFGIFGATMGVMNPFNMMFAVGSIQLVSHLVARGGEHPGAVFRQCLQSQLLLAILYLASMELAAGWISRLVLQDETYVSYLRIAALIPVFYALRCLYQGYLNAVHRFRDQSWLDAGASLSRMVLVVAGATLGLGATGALAGYVFSAALLAFIAFVWVRPERGEVPRPLRSLDIHSFQVKVLLVTLATYYLTSLDLLAVKALSSTDPSVADRYAGYFTASQKLAQIPMSLVVALAYALFPYIAKESGTVGRSEGARIIRGGMRAVLLILAPCCAILASTYHETLVLVFPALGRAISQTGDPIAVASAPLFWLALGYCVYSLLIISCTLITAAGNPGRSLLIMLVCLVAGWFGSRGLVESMGPSGAALGLSLAWSLGLLASIVSLVSRYGTFVSPWSALRIFACAAATYLVSLQIPAAGFSLLVKDGCLLLVYGALIVGSGEMKRAEILRLLEVLKSTVLRGPRSS